MNAFATGVAFGAALTAAGVYQPSVIIGQLRLENWHMIQSFLTATAASGILLEVARRLGLADFTPRGYSSLGLFRRLSSKANDSLPVPYDGNIVGGLLLGTGMAISGACPGTVLAQVGVGVSSGIYALSGAVFGGAVWSAILRPFLTRPPTGLSVPAPASCAPAVDKSSKDEEGRHSRAQDKVTVQEVLGLSRLAALFGTEALFSAVIAATVLLTSPGPEARIHPVIGGLVIGSAQLVSILLRQTLLGVSASYEEMGNWLRSWLVCADDGADKNLLLPQRKFSNVLFSAGIISGAWMLATVVPQLAKTTAVPMPPIMAGLGGFLMVVGARIAGGCTSGHGISGISLLSMSSIITIGVAFSWGSVVVRLAELL